MQGQQFLGHISMRACEVFNNGEFAGKDIDLEMASMGGILMSLLIGDFKQLGAVLDTALYIKVVLAGIKSVGRKEYIAHRDKCFLLDKVIRQNESSTLLPRLMYLRNGEAGKPDKIEANALFWPTSE